MKRIVLFGLLLSILCNSAALGTSGEIAVELVEQKKIWSGQQHSAFSDLIYFREQFFCSFREGQSHASPDGIIRVLRSDTGDHWETVAILSHPERDLRDPQVTKMPDGRLMMLGGATRYEPDESGKPVIAYAQNFVAFSNDGVEWSQPRIVGEPGWWLWRITWLENTGYGVAYAFPESIRLLRTSDGVNYEHIESKLPDEQSPNEAIIRFAKNGQAYCLLRREGERIGEGPRYTRTSALLGTSHPPYHDWQWKDLGIYLGGPNFIQIDDGLWIAGGRTRLGPAQMTLLLLDVENGSVDILKHLPSGGDCSYPGMVWHDNILWVSYYSSHEGKSNIYLAKVRFTPATKSNKNDSNTVQSRPLPDFGIMLNEDGDFSFTDIDLDKSEANLRRMIRSLDGTPVRTLVHNVASGSDIMLYPTQVASNYGWRKTSAEQKPPWDERMPILRTATEAGVDAIRIAAEEAKTMGMYFIPSLRINDAHYCYDPLNNVLTGEFWVKHHKQLELGESPLFEVESWKHLLDFTHGKVRAYRLAVLREVIDRYSDIMDGLQIDFLRHPILFPPGKAGERSYLMTEFVREVRAYLDEASRREGRFLSLHVRVPSSLRNCDWAGLNLRQWLEERLVDVVIPGGAMTLYHCMPIDEFTALAEPVGAKVYPAIFNRNQFVWPLLPKPKAADYAIGINRMVTPPQVRAAAANYLAMGASGFEMYNFNLPPYALPDFYDCINALADPWDGDRVYYVTPSHFFCYNNTFEYRKQIPLELKSGSTEQLKIFVGERFADTSERRALRLGLRGIGKSSELNLDVAINDIEIHSGSVKNVALPVSGSIGRRGRNLHPHPAEYYVQWSINDSSIIRQGHNDIAVTLSENDQKLTIQIVEVQIGIFASQVVR